MKSNIVQSQEKFSLHKEKHHAELVEDIFSFTEKII